MVTEETNLASGIGRLYATLWTHAHGHRKKLVVALGMLVAAQGIRLSIPWLFGRSVHALEDGARVDDAGRSLLFILLAAVAAWALHGPARVIERSVALVARERLAESLYARATALPLGFHQRRHSGDTLHRVQKTTSALFQFSQHQFVYLQNVVSVVGPIVALCAVSLPTGLAALAGYGVVGLVLLRFDKLTVRLVRAENAAERRYVSALTDCLGNIATILTLRLEEATRRMIRARIDDVSHPLRRHIAVNEAKWGTIDLLNTAMRTGLVALYGALAWQDAGVILVGTAVMVYQYAQQLGSVVGSMAGHWGELVRQQTDIASADVLFEVADERPRETPPIDDEWRIIEVRGLCATHPPLPGQRHERRVLDDVSLTLRRGQRIALVGGSGAGKSSLLRALAGLHPSRGARFFVDGREQGALADLGGGATLVPQDPEIFEASVLHNLTLGLPCAMSELRSACDAARFTDVLKDLPEGLETLISERGGNLSGGQKQRLALARGLIASRDSSLVFLDEPTSSVDPITEAAMYDGVFRALPRACVVSAIHRLHLLPRFDTIVLLDEGRVVDAGTLDELLSRQPAFVALWRGQARAGEQRVAAA